MGRSVSSTTVEIREIAWIEPFGTSVNSNPRYKVGFTDGSVLFTQWDASCNYEINNPEYRDGPVLLTLSRHGRIVYINLLH